MRIQPISPSALRPTAEEQLDELIATMNELLQRDGLTRYGGRHISTSLIRIPQLLHTSFIRAYEGAGWHVRYVADQRDGDYWEFKER